MIDSRILTGLIAILIAIGSVVYVGINEPDRQEHFKKVFAARSVENGAALFGEYCSPCHGIKGEGIPGVGPGLNTPEFFNERLKQLGYQGSLRSFVRLTVASGRPVKSGEAQYPRNMPTWSVEYGGPMRHDQVDAVTDYVMHWGEFYEAGQAGPLPTTPMDCDTPAECGQVLFQNLGCIGCHKIKGEGGAVGPELTSIYADKDPDYIRQSILNPNAVIADGFQGNIMPPNFGERIGDTEMDSLIAYLASVSQ